MKYVIDEIEKQTKASEHDISNLIRKHVPKDEDMPFELHSEALAFGFTENLSEENSNWNTYFKPMFVWQNEDGTLTESPSIQRSF
jgi:hypothetical protein